MISERHGGGVGGMSGSLTAGSLKTVLTIVRDFAKSSYEMIDIGAGSGISNISFVDEYPQRSLLNIMDNEGDQMIYVEFHKQFLTYDTDYKALWDQYIARINAFYEVEAPGQQLQIGTREYAKLVDASWFKIPNGMLALNREIDCPVIMKEFMEDPAGDFWNAEEIVPTNVILEI
ncbi:hypothetical protein CEUSTIGMA_g1526.t1 [Chlamydomonas eustigma]|uniref:Uncharacterized protein n=1 Tax=Chlamydomonas eustigma TaxID=1157962 RepID=A0A250WTJ4_9CHLO|nr:hypothetical protein CEUSTIGMA_g1526.t1 [Chlamydomonas eustigma]|eukprot:GAX74076.1 hypothetical protein CEUSTIGMA_g1526.t1 [Chlamydomonas eustigma]